MSCIRLSGFCFWVVIKFLSIERSLIVSRRADLSLVRVVIAPLMAYNYDVFLAHEPADYFSGHGLTTPREGQRESAGSHIAH